MGWFSPVKGSYPSLAQVDKTLPVDGTLKIKRGTIVALGSTNGEAVWKLPTATDKVLYVALQDSTDPTAGFAGTAFVPNPTASNPARPAVTGIDLAQDGEYETSVYDPEAEYQIGSKLKANANGVLTVSTGDNDVVCGVVTAVPAARWVNNAVAVPASEEDARLAYRTGSRVKVIRFKTAL